MPIKTTNEIKIIRMMVTILIRVVTMNKIAPEKNKIKRLNASYLKRNFSTDS